MVTKLEREEGFPRDVPFDYQLAMDRLRHYRAPRDRLRRLRENGQVIQVKCGLYVSGDVDPLETRVHPRVLSGLVYGPSYVSLETALAQYGMIPESVDEITCVTFKRAKCFVTPVGRFRYRSIPERVFPEGVKLEYANGVAYLMALPEKALCDRIAQVRGIATQREVQTFLLEDLRIEEDSLWELDVSLISSIAEKYRRKSVTCFAKWMAGKNGCR